MDKTANFGAFMPHANPTCTGLFMATIGRLCATTPGADAVLLRGIKRMPSYKV
jgi:hypothetical protein